MSREDIVKELIDSGLLIKCVDYQLRRQPQHYANRQDIISDAWMWILTYDEEKLIDAANGKHLNALITRYLQNQLFSKTSEYFRKYVKFNNLSDDLNNAKGVQS